MEFREHPSYRLTINAINAIRDAVKGSVAVKAKGQDYLPHPSDFDTVSPEAKARYDKYLQGAEWDAYPEQTKRAMVGKLRIGNAVVELPDRVNYLTQDADGDGMSLKAMMRQTSDEILQVKWHLLVADYRGLTDIPIESVSIADVQALNPRAVIKAYSRENVVYWHFSRANGVLQLSYLLLRECGSVLDPVTLKESAVESYLALMLDENGNYQQKKYVKGGDSSFTESESVDMKINNQPLKWLPVQIATDEQGETGKLPDELGFLSAICDLTFARYVMSAEYKATCRSMAATTNVTGWNSNSSSIFQEANGRAYFATGFDAVNFLPEGAAVDQSAPSASVEHFERFFDANEKKIRSLGGVIISDSMTDKTAAEVNTNAAEQNARLSDVADGIEAAYKRIVAYCMMFENAAPMDSVESALEQIKIEISRDFAAAKMSVPEVQAWQQLVLLGHATKEQLVKALIAGGWYDDEVDAILASLETTV